MRLIRYDEPVCRHAQQSAQLLLIGPYHSSLIARIRSAVEGGIGTAPPSAVAGGAECRNLTTGHGVEVELFACFQCHSLQGKDTDKRANIQYRCESLLVQSAL